MFSNITSQLISPSQDQRVSILGGSKDRLSQPQGLPKTPDMLLLVPNPEEEKQTQSFSVSRAQQTEAEWRLQLNFRLPVAVPPPHSLVSLPVSCNTEKCHKEAAPSEVKKTKKNPKKQKQKPSQGKLGHPERDN